MHGGVVPPNDDVHVTLLAMASADLFGAPFDERENEEAEEYVEPPSTDESAVTEFVTLNSPPVLDGRESVYMGR